MTAFASAEKSFLRAWPAAREPVAARAVAAILVAALLVAAILVAERRIAGALLAPLGPLAMLLTAAIAALCASAARYAWRAGGEELSGNERAASLAWLAPTTVTNGAIRWLPAAALVILGASLWLPGTSLAAIGCFWTVALAEEAWNPLPRRASKFLASASAPSHGAEVAEWHVRPAAESASSAGVEQSDFEACDLEARDLEATGEIDHEALEAEGADEPGSPPSGHVKLAGPHYDPPRPPAPAGLCDPPHLEPAAPHFGLANKSGDPTAPADERIAPSDERVIQQLTRSTTREGVDVLRGSLCATFPPGLRTLSVHVAFCPAFAERPRMEFRQTSGPAARIKLAQLLAFGARFDIKLGASAQVDEMVVLDISASHP